MEFVHNNGSHGKHDMLMAKIMEEERDLYPFFDAVFGFLWRKTDFFDIKKSGKTIGFPPGQAENLVLKVFRKWQNLPCLPNRGTQWSQRSDTNNAGAAQENANVASSIPKPTIIKAYDGPSRLPGNSSDVYNGANRGDYLWSQTIRELDIVVPVPEHISKSHEVMVKLTDQKLSVSVKTTSRSDSEWKSLVEGEFCFKINKEESVWSLVPKEYISIHCEKTRERWWDGLMTFEPKLDTRKFDPSRPSSDLNEESLNMKLEEIMFNKQQKAQGQKTVEQLRTESILRQAWNLEGSPFKGTTFDPSVLQYGLE